MDQKRDKLLCDYIVQQGISNARLRDEILLQIVNQTRNNNNTDDNNNQSNRNAWQLMANCLSCFMPPLYFFKYLLKYILDYGIDEYKGYCQNQMLKYSSNDCLDYQQMCRLYPPCFLEWTANTKCHRYGLKIEIINNDFKKENIHQEVDSWTSGEQFCESVLSSLNINEGESKGWSLCLFNDDNLNEDKYYYELMGNDWTLDLISERELHPSFPRSPHNLNRIFSFEQDDIEEEEEEEEEEDDPTPLINNNNSNLTVSKKDLDWDPYCYPRIDSQNQIDILPQSKINRNKKTKNKNKNKNKTFVAPSSATNTATSSSPVVINNNNYTNLIYEDSLEVKPQTTEKNKKISMTSSTNNNNNEKEKMFPQSSISSVSMDSNKCNNKNYNIKNESSPLPPSLPPPSLVKKKQIESSNETNRLDKKKSKFRFHFEPPKAKSKKITINNLSSTQTLNDEPKTKKQINNLDDRSFRTLNSNSNNETSHLTNEDSLENNNKNIQNNELTPIVSQPPTPQPSTATLSKSSRLNTRYSKQSTCNNNNTLIEPNNGHLFNKSKQKQKRLNKNQQQITNTKKQLKKISQVSDYQMINDAIYVNQEEIILSQEERCGSDGRQSVISNISESVMIQSMPIPSRRRDVEAFLDNIFERALDSSTGPRGSGSGSASGLSTQINKNKKQVKKNNKIKNTKNEVHKKMRGGLNRNY
jgi:hypothetical protein